MTRRESTTQAGGTATSGPTPYTDPVLNAGRNSAPLPTFERLSEINPVFTPSDITWSGGTTPDNLQSLELVDTSEVPNTRDDVYAFVTVHGGGGTGLFTAPHPTGPWTTVGGVDSELEEGDVIYNSQTDQWVSYRNTGNLEIVRKTSPDGETWGNATTVISSGGHAGYPRIYREAGGWWLHSFRKQTEENSRAVCYYSDDGLDFAWTSLAWNNRRAPSGYDDTGYDYLDPAIVPWYHGYLLFYIDNIRADVGCDIRMGWTQDGVTITDLGIALDATDNDTWEQSNLKRPCPFVFDGDLYLGYGAGSGAGGDHSIGLARATGVN